jgi:hypothetical protein
LPESTTVDSARAGAPDGLANAAIPMGRIIVETGDNSSTWTVTGRCGGPVVSFLPQSGKATAASAGFQPGGDGHVPVIGPMQTGNVVTGRRKDLPESSGSAQ